MRVDFYIVEDADERAFLRLACRLAEKAYAQSHQVCIAASSAEEAQVLDKLLWTFRDRSFIPHEVLAGAKDAEEPIVITPDAPPPGMRDVLINLRKQVPEEFTRFQRVIEPLDADATRRRLGRERFKFYREQGITPESHNLSADHEI